MCRGAVSGLPGAEREMVFAENIIPEIITGAL